MLMKHLHREMSQINSRERSVSRPSLHETIVSMLAISYFGIWIVLDYVSIKGVPVGTAVIIMLFVLILHEPRIKAKNCTGYYFVLFLKLAYFILLILVSIWNGFNFSGRNIYVVASIFMNVVTYVVVFRLLYFRYISLKQVLLLITVAFSLSSFVAILQMQDISIAWSLREYFLSFEEYSRTTNRGLNIFNLGYPVGLSLTSVDLGTQLTYWLPIVMFVVPSILNKTQTKTLTTRTISFTLIIICSLGLYSSQLRSGLYGTLVAAVLGILFYYSSSKEGRPFDRSKPLKIYLTAVVLILVMWFVLALSPRFSTVTDVTSLNEDLRFDLWRQTWVILVQSFPGDGLTNLTRQALGVDIGWHNQVLIIASQLSFMGLMLFVFLVTWLVKKLGNTLRLRSNEARMYGYYLGLGIVVSGLFNSMFHNINYFTQSNITTAMLAMFVFSISQVKVPSQDSSPTVVNSNHSL